MALATSVLIPQRQKVPCLSFWLCCWSSGSESAERAPGQIFLGVEAHRPAKLKSVLCSLWCTTPNQPRFRSAWPFQPSFCGIRPPHIERQEPDDGTEIAEYFNVKLAEPWRLRSWGHWAATAVLPLAGLIGCIGEIDDLDGRQGAGAAGGSGGGGGATNNTVNGYVRHTLHRLNRLEYNNTVRDLLNTSLSPADAFPPDTESEGFDNMAAALQLPPRPSSTNTSPQLATS